MKDSPPTPQALADRLRLSGAERDAAVRATLEPLAPGERPVAVTIGAVLAVLSGGGQLALFAFGVKLHVAGTKAAAGSTIVFGVMMLICALRRVSSKLKYCCRSA